MRAMVVGAGAVGARVARQLAGVDTVDLLAIVDTDGGQAAAVAASLGAPAAVGRWDPDSLESGEVVVLACPGPHLELAQAAVRRAASVVSLADGIDDVRGLLALDEQARSAGVTVAVGAGFAPGLTCVLARHAAAGFDSVDEVYVAKAGTGGPACARDHHRALTGEALDWRDGEWSRRRAGSGRELCWFPDPLGALDCYRGGLADALLLVPAFPGVRRVTARVAASRRDRLTARLPMLRQPHPEGLLGAARVEVRGRRGPATDVHVLGALDRPAIAAGIVAGVTAAWVLDGRLGYRGAGGLGQLIAEPVPFLHDLAQRGVRAAVFEGAGAAAPAPATR
ncbi:MAG: saccharopine dehydrogenase family protein [Acidimicrobiales bacterium]